jgi:nucleotide-binding universal stress UspA family protein
MKKLDLVGLYLEDVLRYSKVFNANVHFINIVQGKKIPPVERKNELAEVKKLVESSHKHIFHRLPDRDIPEAIGVYAQENNVHLIFVVRHQHGFLESLFHKDLSDSICLRSKIPVMVMKEKAD